MRIYRSGPYGPNRVEWFSCQWAFGGDWTAMVSIRPTWSFVLWLSLSRPSFEIDLGLVRFNVGRYPEPDLTPEEWAAIDAWPGDSPPATETKATATCVTTWGTMRVGDIV